MIDEAMSAKYALPAGHAAESAAKRRRPQEGEPNDETPRAARRSSGSGDREGKGERGQGKGGGYGRGKGDGGARQEGEEAGVKSCTLLVEGEFANGFLKAEKGVHRLVRISPFDSNKRRHTSFVSIDIMPEFPDNAPINIEMKDLRVDTYRASGAGGQHVNRTDSAVRLTHLPTGLVVSCQMQRDQHKNKDMCMKMLAAKLEDLAKSEQDKLAASVGGEKTEIGWGRQIRSYVLDDRRVKDLRTGHQTSNTEAVLDGDLDPFINAYLRSGSNQNANVSDD